MDSVRRGLLSAAIAVAAVFLAGCGHSTPSSNSSVVAAPPPSSAQQTAAVSPSDAAPPAAQTGGFDGAAAYDFTAKLVAFGPRPPGSDAIARFGALGWAVVTGPSDWAFGPEDAAIQGECLAGWAAAANEMGDLPRAEVERWVERRSAHISQRRSSIRVGHVDFFASPIGAR